ncbi:hypothetical protein PMAYCL1PPCAC_25022, partial [Pristionchus mayeri]
QNGRSHLLQGQHEQSEWPFTEREIQELYRKGKQLKGSFTFYFTRSDEAPSDEDNSGITLDSLRSLNGTACPFARVDEMMRGEERERRDKEERLDKIEKDIAELHQQYDALSIEQTIEKVNRSVESLRCLEKKESSKQAKNETTNVQKEQKVKEGPKPAVSGPKKRQKTTAIKPDMVPQGIWNRYYELMISVADLVLDAFDMYATGNFSSWDKNRVKNIESAIGRVTGMERLFFNLMGVSVLSEVLKKEEFFCCKLCSAYFFNDQATYVHFMSNEHRRK